MVKFVEDFRRDRAQLPTIKDFVSAGFDESIVDLAERKKIIEKFYVNLTNGSIVKGYKVKK